MVESGETYYSISEVAKKLRVDYQVIRSLVIAGHLKATKVGKQYRILKEDMEEYIEKNSNHSIV